MIFGIMKKIIILFILILFSFNGLYPQEEKLKVASIKIEGTDQTREQAIKFTSQLNVGSEITGEDVQRTIKRLWGLGMFSNIQIEEESRTDAGSNLVIKVKEFPRLKSIEISGNKAVKLKDIEEKLNFYQSMYINPLKLKNSFKKVQSLYTDKGYLLAELNPKENYSEDRSLVSLNLNIDEGKKVQIKKITFFGNNSFSNKTLRKQFDKTKEDTWWRGADFKREEFEKDKGKVLEFYRNNGYRDAFVVSDSVRYSEDKTGLFLDITVNESIKYYFGEIVLNGNIAYSQRDILDKFEFGKGDEYNEEKFNKTMQNVGTMYQDDGYIFLSMIPQEIPVAKDTVKMVFNITEGNRVRINDVAVTGNTKTKEYVIRREITSKPGNMFSRE